MDVSGLSTIRDFSEGWVDGAGRPAPKLSSWEYLSFACGMPDAAAFATLFWPEFMVDEGAVFLQERFSADALEQFIGRGSSRLEAAAVVNHVHVGDLFPYRVEQIDSEVAMFLAEVLRSCWSAKVSAEFGEGVVEIVIDPGVEDPQLVLVQRTLLPCGL